MKNLGLKLISVALAAGIWWVVSAPHREPVIERRFAAPLSIVGPPRDFVITTPVPDSVSVRLRGRASDINAVSSQTLDVPVDVSWIQQSGDVTITMHPQAVHKPPDIEVVALDPNKLKFHVDVLRQRAVAIRPFLIGQPPQGYIIGDATANPALALVSGPGSQIVKMNEVSTERINMTGRTATFVQDVAVVSDTPLVRIVAPVTTQVTVPIIAEAPPATETTETTGTTAPETKKETKKP